MWDVHLFMSGILEARVGAVKLFADRLLRGLIARTEHHAPPLEHLHGSLACGRVRPVGEAVGERASYAKNQSLEQLAQA